MFKAPIDSAVRIDMTVMIAIIAAGICMLFFTGVIFCFAPF